MTLTGARMYILATIEHVTRRVRILGSTGHPTAAWVTQAVRNLGMDLHDAGCQARFLIRDRDGKYPALFDTILADTGITVVLTGVQMPRMNAIMERWIQTCRYELLDPHADLQPAPPAARPSGIRVALQRAPIPPRDFQRTAPASAAQTDHQPRHDHAPDHPPP
ncbi:hypothetical protein [Micromonospora sp. NPDC023633]|uniref:hypothetical protein n=1 Tax=Micromonospora sp. NPDC023633 TaxID=3154320 RepID=UPI0033C8490D